MEPEGSLLASGNFAAENSGFHSELWKTSALGTVIAYSQEYSQKDRLEIDYHKQYILDSYKLVAGRHNFD